MSETYTFAAAYELPRWPFVPPPELESGLTVRHPIVIVGAGPAGLTLACDLASRGVRCVRMGLLAPVASTRWSASMA